LAAIENLKQDAVWRNRRLKGVDVDRGRPNQLSQRRYENGTDMCKDTSTY
jgi:hypothetical protein